MRLILTAAGAAGGGRTHAGQALDLVPLPVWATAACPRMESNHHRPGPEPSASASWATGAVGRRGIEPPSTRLRVYSPPGSPPAQPPRRVGARSERVAAPALRRAPSSASQAAAYTRGSTVTTDTVAGHEPPATR